MLDNKTNEPEHKVIVVGMNEPTAINPVTMRAGVRAVMDAHCSCGWKSTGWYDRQYLQLEINKHTGDSQC